MKNNISTSTLLILAAASSISAYADDNDFSCAVQVAVATPPMTSDQNVAFNVTGDNGTNKAITLKGLSAPQTIQGIACSDSATVLYNISATLYSTASNPLLPATPWIGQCKLTAGPIALYSSDSIASVVFPNDFSCG